MKPVDLNNCHLCPRECGAQRTDGEKGYCGADGRMLVSRASLHAWEEPCISGKNGSGTIFFSGCSLGCLFCQNHEISEGNMGRQISVRELADLCLILQKQNAHNINLVTAGHYVPLAAEALRIARESGLKIPVVYNSSGYEKPQALKMLDGLVDIYLPDFKYMDAKLAAAYSHAEDYPETAKAALQEMVRQTGGMNEFSEDGMMKKGVIVRLLLLPGHVKDAKLIVKYLYETYKDQIYVSLMNQYTPMPAVSRDPDLSRRVTPREYRRLIDYALSIGLTNGFIQEGETAQESFIPPFQEGGFLNLIGR